MMNIGEELVDIVSPKNIFQFSLIFSKILQVKKKIILRIVLEFVENSVWVNRNRCSRWKNQSWYNFKWNRKLNCKKIQAIIEPILQCVNSEFQLRNSIRLWKSSGEPDLQITLLYYGSIYDHYFAWIIYTNKIKKIFDCIGIVLFGTVFIHGNLTIFSRTFTKLTENSSTSSSFSVIYTKIHKHIRNS